MAKTVDEDAVAHLGAVAVAREEIPAVSDPAAQGIATDQDGHNPEDQEVQHAGVEDGFQDALALWAHKELSGVREAVVSWRTTPLIPPVFVLRAVQ